MHLPRATTDAGALRHNLQVVRRYAPRSRVMAALKSNAYGHGAVWAAQALDAADAFGVARLEEAIALRNAGCSKRIVLLEGVCDAEDVARAGALSIDLVVHTLEQIEALEGRHGADRFDVWVKLDTGMHRLGLPADAVQPAIQRLRRLRAVNEIRFLSHLASAEDLADSTSAKQLERFEQITRGVAAERSLANSAAIIARPETHFEWVRPGLMLYGMSPFIGRSAAELGLRPAMTLATRLIAIHALDAGEAVGYGAIWRAIRRSTIGVAAIGYGDGYPRSMRNGTPVLVRGLEAPLAGRVSMDMITIDLTDLPEMRLGEQVILWGSGLPAERVAQCAGTLGYELVCRVTERVQRNLVNG